MPLDARLENERLKKLYEEQNVEKLNIILMGDGGTGKTYIARTARLPVFIDCFERGGATCLRDEIKRGDILVRRWDNEDPLKPTAFDDWKREFTAKVESNYFAQFGTYMLDSSTVWAESIMNSVLKAASRAGDQPKWNEDYPKQKALSVVWLKRILNLPCDVIVTGHVEPLKDELIGSIEYRYIATGKSSTTIPLEFDEKWVSITKETAAGVVYQILTRRTGKYMASSRLAALGKLETYEEPNIKAILKKCGYDTKDKPPLFGAQ